MFRSTIFAIGAVALWACAAGSAPAPLLPHPADALVTEADQYLQQPERVADRVTVFASPDPFHIQPLGNVTAIEQSDGFVLIDAGGTPAAAQRIIAALDAMSDKPVTAIVITHWHGDHVLGLRTLLARWPDARTISTAPTRANLISEQTARFMPTEDEDNNRTIQANLAAGVQFLEGRASDPQFSERERAGYAQSAREIAQHAQDLLRASRIAPRETFGDRLLLDDPVAPVEVLFLGRANTDGDAVAWLPRQRVLVTGDVVVSPIPYGFGSYPGDWIAVLERMKAMAFAVLVPGHGRVMRDAVYLDRLISLLRDVRAQVGPLAASHTLEQVQAQVNLEPHADLFSGGNLWMRRWFKPYWADPIVASAYREARGEPIVQGGS